MWEWAGYYTGPEPTTHEYMRTLEEQVPSRSLLDFILNKFEEFTMIESLLGDLSTPGFVEEILEPCEVESGAALDWVEWAGYDVGPEPTSHEYMRNLQEVDPTWVPRS